MVKFWCGQDHDSALKEICALRVLLLVYLFIYLSIPFYEGKSHLCANEK